MNPDSTWVKAEMEDFTDHKAFLRYGVLDSLIPDSWKKNCQKELKKAEECVRRCGYEEEDSLECNQGFKMECSCESTEVYFTLSSNLKSVSLTINLQQADKFLGCFPSQWPRGSLFGCDLNVPELKISLDSLQFISLLNPWGKVLLLQLDYANKDPLDRYLIYKEYKQSVNEYFIIEWKKKDVQH